MNKTDKEINYNFFHWGPFLYKTTLTENELEDIKNLCVKDPKKTYEKNLAGLIKHEYELDEKKIFSIIKPYLISYSQAYLDYGIEPLGNKIEIKAAWVNYMTKFESNPLHQHKGDLSFIIYTDIPEKLKEEAENCNANTKPGCIYFINKLEYEKYCINKHTFIPEVGDFFIFPGCLNHGVNHFQSEGERVSISGNLIITNG